MRNLIILFIFSFFISNYGISQSNGYTVNVKLINYEYEELILANYFGDQQYVKDTAKINEEGTFIFEYDEKLDPGLYLIVLQPNNNIFQLLVSDQESNLNIEADALNLTKSLKISGSPDNQYFQGYVDFLSSKRPKAESLKKQLNDLKKENKETADLESQITALDQEVKDHQKNIIAKFPNSITSLIIKANLPVNIPDFEGTNEEIGYKKFYYSKEHFFDNYDFKDERLLRTPFLYQTINRYVEDMTPNHPDSICKSLNLILDKFNPESESFKFFLIHYLNKYAKSEIVGYDAIYVNLVERYYEKGFASWTEPEQLEKMVRNARTLKPLLIGKIAPNLTLFKKDGSSISLHEVQSQFTVLFFWAPDCGHCQESMPDMLKFYEDYNNKGVEIFAVCTKHREKVADCWKMIDEKGMGAWINITDPNYVSGFRKVYDIKTTPQIYVLDDNKEILVKRIGSEQLPEIMDTLLKMDQD